MTKQKIDKDFGEPEVITMFGDYNLAQKYKKKNQVTVYNPDINVRAYENIEDNFLVNYFRKFRNKREEWNQIQKDLFFFSLTSIIVSFSIILVPSLIFDLIIGDLTGFFILPLIIFIIITLTYFSYNGIRNAIYIFKKYGRIIE